MIAFSVVFSVVFSVEFSLRSNTLLRRTRTQMTTETRAVSETQFAYQFLDVCMERRSVCSLGTYGFHRHPVVCVWWYMRELLLLLQEQHTRNTRKNVTLHALPESLFYL